MTDVSNFMLGVGKDEFTHTQIAQKIVDMGYGVDFITIAIGMLSNQRCDLDGKVGEYASDMEAIARKAIYTLQEEKE